MANCELAKKTVAENTMPKKMAEFLARGGRITKCPTKTVRGRQPHRQVLAGQFLPREALAPTLANHILANQASPFTSAAYWRQILRSRGEQGLNRN